MKFRVAEHRWAPFCQQLLARTDVESAGILIGEPVATPAGTFVVVRDAIAVADAAYLIRRRDQLSIDPVALNRLTRPARDRGWSVFTVHTHPGASEPWFSTADDAGDARLMPSLNCQIPDAPHGSIVLVDNGRVAARVFDGNAVSQPNRPPGGRPDARHGERTGRGGRAVVRATSPCPRRPRAGRPAAPAGRRRWPGRDRLARFVAARASGRRRARATRRRPCRGVQPLPHRGRDQGRRRAQAQGGRRGGLRSLARPRATDRVPSSVCRTRTRAAACELRRDRVLRRPSDAAGDTQPGGLPQPGAGDRSRHRLPRRSRRERRRRRWTGRDRRAWPAVSGLLGTPRPACSADSRLSRRRTTRARSEPVTSREPRSRSRAWWPSTPSLRAPASRSSCVSRQRLPAPTRHR